MNTVQRGSAARDRVDVEAGQEHHPGAGREHAVCSDEQAVGVEDRQGVQEHVAGPEAPRVGERRAVRREVALREHHALRRTGRAARVQHGGEVLGMLGDVVEGVRLVRRVVGEAPPPGGVHRERHRSGWRSARRVVDEHHRSRVADDVSHLGVGRRRVDRDQRGAGAEARPVDEEERWALVDLDGHPVARGHAEVRERAGEARRRRVGLAVRDRGAPRHLEQHGGRIGGSTPVEELAERGGVEHQPARKSRSSGIAARSWTKKRWPPS